MVLGAFLLVFVSVVSGLSITARTTGDGNTDGHIDRIVLTFDGSISTIATALDQDVQNGAFVVLGYNTIGFTSTSGTVGYVSLTPLAVADTGATPLTKYTAPAGSSAGVTSDATWQVASDAAAPLLLAANIAADGLDDSVSLLFSEAVFGTMGSPSSGPLPYTDATLTPTAVTCPSPASLIDYYLNNGDQKIVMYEGDNSFATANSGCTKIKMTTGFDLAGNLIPSVDITLASSGATPDAIVSLEYVDQDNNGHIDAVRFNSARPWRDATFGNGMSIAAAALTSPADRSPYILSTGSGEPNVDLNDQYMFLNFTEDSAYDTGISLNFRFGSTLSPVPEDWTGPFTSGASRGGGAWNNAPLSNVVLVDKARPILYQASTMDMDNDGQIDAIRLKFSEPMADSTNVASDWSVTNPSYSVSSLSSGTANDDTVDLILTEKTSPDTGVTPTVKYIGSTFADLHSNILYTKSIVARDAVAPRILTATGTAFQTTLVIQFSEGVVSNSGGNLAVSSFSYTDGANGGVTSIASLTQPNAATSGSVTAAANTLFANSDFGVNGDSVAAVSNAIKDNAGNVCGTEAVKLVGISGAMASAIFNVWFCFAMITVAVFAM